MTDEIWSQVDEYFDAALGGQDPVLEAALAESDGAGLPAIQVTPHEGRFLHLLARAVHARRILEIGTLGGYSTIWLARALATGGQLVTLEADEHHAEVARKNIERAGLGHVVDLRVGKALDTLPRVAGEGGEPFDFTFIDADKANIPAYFDWAIRLSRPGSLIVVDNVVRKGAVVDPSNDSADIQGIRRFIETLAAERRVIATALQTVGAKGYDGFAIALVQK